MPLRSVLDIRIEDSRLEAFVAQLRRYQEAAASTTAEWDRAAAVSGEGTVTMRDLTAALLTTAEVVRATSDEHRRRGRSVAQRRVATADVGSALDEVYHRVGDTGREVMRWTGIATVFSAVLGGMATWGIEHLSAVATSTQTAALSRGVTPQQMLALRETYGTYADVDADLTNVINLRQALNPVFSNLGIPVGGDTAATYVAAVARIRQLYRTSDPTTVTMQPWWQLATEILSPQEIRTFGGLNDQQFARVFPRYQSYLTDYGVGGAFDAARDVMQALRHVADVLETTLLKALEPVFPKIIALADRVEKAAVAFMKGPGFDRLLTTVERAMENLGQLITSNTFVQITADFSRAVYDLAVVADKLVNVLLAAPSLFGQMIVPEARAALPPPSQGVAPGPELVFPATTPAGATSTGNLPAVTAGPVCDQIIATARAMGANDGAILAMLSGALGEGGLTEAWKPGDYGTSFGPWQLHRGGELGGYLAQGGTPGDVTAQTRYVLRRLNEIMPGFSTSRDQAAQLEAVRRFERSRSGASYAPHYGQARRVLGQYETTTGNETDVWHAVRNAPGVKFNSRGEPYSTDLDTMSVATKRAVAASMAAIRAQGFPGYTPPQSRAAPQLVSHLRLHVMDDTSSLTIAADPRW